MKRLSIAVLMTVSLFVSACGPRGKHSICELEVRGPTCMGREWTCSMPEEGPAPNIFSNTYLTCYKLGIFEWKCTSLDDGTTLKTPVPHYVDEPVWPRPLYPPHESTD